MYVFYFHEISVITLRFFHFTFSFREIALTVILIKAGLGLDPVALMKLKFVVLRLALVPCIGEAAAVAAAAHFLLGFPWLWGILLG